MKYKQLKALFLPTANAGVTWHRMFKFFKYIKADKHMNPAMDKFDPNNHNPCKWQFYQNSTKMLLHQIEKLVSLSDMLIVGYTITNYGVAILQGLKELFPKKPIVTEIDDYCLELNKYSPAAVTYSPGKEAPNAIIDHLLLSDALIVSTEYLSKLYSKYNKNIYVIPNCIDFSIWDNLKYPKHKKNVIRIGWVGAATHNEDLEFIEPVVYKILNDYKNVEFYFAAGVHSLFVKKHPRIICNNAWYNCYEYPQSIVDKKFDIGLAPLLDNNFNRGKSNLRWLEYSAMKIPTVASNIEPFKKSIVSGKTGFLCNEINEWESSLRALIEDKTLRNKIGLSAYKEIKKNFNIIKISKKYIKILKEIKHDFK